MSVDYLYYLGYQKDNKIYPLGPYDANGKLLPVLHRTRNSSSELYEKFYLLPDEKVSEPLKKLFEYEDWAGKKRVQLLQLPLSQLPHGDYIKHGYFLREDVQAYLSGEADTRDIFYYRLAPEVYAAKIEAEATLPKIEKNDEEYQEPSAREYMYFAYADYYSEAYEVKLLHSMAEIFEDSDILQDTDAELIFLLDIC